MLSGRTGVGVAYAKDKEGYTVDALCMARMQLIEKVLSWDKGLMDIILEHRPLENVTLEVPRVTKPTPNQKAQWVDLTKEAEQYAKNEGFFWETLLQGPDEWFVKAVVMKATILNSKLRDQQKKLEKSGATDAQSAIKNINDFLKRSHLFKLARNLTTIMKAKAQLLQGGASEIHGICESDIFDAGQDEPTKAFVLSPAGLMLAQVMDIDDDMTPEQVGVGLKEGYRINGLRFSAETVPPNPDYADMRVMAEPVSSSAIEASTLSRTEAIEQLSTDLTSPAAIMLHRMMDEMSLAAIGMIANAPVSKVQYDSVEDIHRDRFHRLMQIPEIAKSALYQEWAKQEEALQGEVLKVLPEIDEATGKALISEEDAGPHIKKQPSTSETFDYAGAVTDMMRSLAATYPKLSSVIENVDMVSQEVERVVGLAHEFQSNLGLLQEKCPYLYALAVGEMRPTSVEASLEDRIVMKDLANDFLVGFREREAVRLMQVRKNEIPADWYHPPNFAPPLAKRHPDEIAPFEGYVGAIDFGTSDYRGKINGYWSVLCKSAQGVDDYFRNQTYCIGSELEDFSEAEMALYAIPGVMYWAQCLPEALCLYEKKIRESTDNMLNPSFESIWLEVLKAAMSGEGAEALDSHEWQQIESSLSTFEEMEAKINNILENKIDPDHDQTLVPTLTNLTDMMDAAKGVRDRYCRMLMEQKEGTLIADVVLHYEKPTLAMRFRGTPLHEAYEKEKKRREETQEASLSKDSQMSDGPRSFHPQWSGGRGEEGDQPGAPQEALQKQDPDQRAQNSQYKSRR